MRKILLAGLVASQVSAVPAAAADLIEDPVIASQDAGSFAGARVRLALGGKGTESQLRAGIVMAPTLLTRTSDRRGSLRFGEGVELGFANGRPLALAIAGRLVTGDDARRMSGPRAGVSTLGWNAIGTGVLLVAGTLVFVDLMNDASE